MNEKFKFIHLIVALALLYGVTYFIFIKSTNGEYFFGFIPQVPVYIITVYFISSILIEITLEKNHVKNLKLSLKKAFILLVALSMYCGIYLLFYKYMITSKHPEGTFFGNITDFIFLFILVFLAIKLSKRLYTS